MSLSWLQAEPRITSQAMLKEQQSALATTGEVTAMSLEEPLWRSIICQAARFVAMGGNCPAGPAPILHCERGVFLLDFAGIPLEACA